MRCGTGPASAERQNVLNPSCRCIMSFALSDFSSETPCMTTASVVSPNMKLQGVLDLHSRPSSVSQISRASLGQKRSLQSSPSQAATSAILIISMRMRACGTAGSCRIVVSTWSLRARLLGRPVNESVRAATSRFFASSRARASLRRRMNRQTIIGRPTATAPRVRRPTALKNSA
ncbi:hypothetical protein D3C86_1655510 [compost metagenome]